MSDLHDNNELMFASKVFDNNHCFLCGTPLNEENKSEEHVYPHWLQKKYNLWNQHLILLNGTAIPYKNLIIPCCKACNRHMGKTFENPIETAVSTGYDAFIRLDKQLIFQWLCKLSYGILFKEMSLLLDRSSPGKGTILSPADLEQERTLFLFLQAVLTNAKFEGHKPYSLIFFRLHSFEDDPYWASDNPLLRTFFMRMGDIGIIANMIAVEKFEEFLGAFESNPFKINENKAFRKQLIDNIIMYAHDHMSLLTAAVLIKKKFTIDEISQNYYSSIDVFDGNWY